MAAHPEAIALKLRQLSSDPENQMYIAREPGCINGLISFLGPTNELRTMLVAAQAIQFLSSHPSNRLLLSGMTNLLQRLSQLATHSNQNLAHFASTALTNLTVANAPGSDHVSSFKKKSLECVKLHIDGLEQYDDQIVQNACLSVGGVVSISLSRRNVANVYSVKKGLAHSLIDALSREGIQAAEIIEKSTVSAPPSAADNGPQYLDHSFFKGRPDSLSLYSDSFEESSLANRLARQRMIQRQKIDQQAKAQNIFTKVWTSIW